MGGRFAMWIVAVLAMLAGPAAQAQMSPLVPDPITTPELMKYAEILGLSDQQKLGLMTAHDNYKTRYREFQDHDVRKLQDLILDIATRFQRNRFMIPERKELEGVVEQYKKVLTGAHAVDRSLFAEVAANLTEEQVQKLPRASNARELAVYRELVINMAGEFNPGAGANLTQMTRKLDLSPQEREQVDQILTEYESVLLSKTHEIYTVLTKAVSVVLDLVDELNIRGMDPQKMMAMMQDQNTIQRLQNTFDEASKPFQAAAFDMSQLNLRTYRRLIGVMRPEQVAELRDRFYRKAYGEAYHGPGDWRDRYHKALEIETLSAQQKEAVTAQRDDYARQDDTLVDQMVSLLEQSREYRTFAQLSRQEAGPRAEKLKDLEQREAAVGPAADAALSAVIGPDLMAQVSKKVNDKEHQAKKNRQRATADAEEDADAVALQAEADAVAVSAAPAEKQAKSPEDALLPQVLPVKQLQALGKRLKWDEQQQASLQSLYDDYRADFEKLRSVPIQEQPAEGSASEAKPADPDVQRRSRFDELAKIDDAFFDNVAILAADDHQQLIVQRYRQLRHRQAATDVARNTAASFTQDEAYVDVVSVVDSCDFSDAVASNVSGILSTYDNAMAQLVTKRMTASQEVHRRQKMQGKLRERKAGANNNKEAADFINSKWREAFKQMRETNKEITTLNRQTLDQLVAQLPNEMAWSLRLGYNQIAYPDVYRDALSAEKVIGAILSMPDLSPPQREQVNEITNQFRTDYYAMCDQIVELQRQRDIDPSNFQMPGRDMMEREILTERLKFDRTEVAERARMRLRLALPAEISRRIPELRKNLP